MKDSSSNVPGKNQPQIDLPNKPRGYLKKESLAAKFKRIFLSPDINNVGEFIFVDVFVPAIKDLIVNIIENTINIAFFGNNSRRPYVIGRPASSAQQRASIYWNSSGNGQARIVQPTEPVKKPVDSYKDLRYPTYVKADETLNALKNHLASYGQVFISDVFRCTEGARTSNFTNYANDYGWTNLDNATIGRDGTEYYLILPKPEFMPD